MNKPTLIVVTGRPGAGKTTLAHALARAVRCPALCRDEFKEGLVNTEGDKDSHGKNVNWHVYDTFFQAIELLIGRGVTLVAEAAFQHKLWAPKLEPLQEIVRMRIVICTIDPTLARARFIQRGTSDPERERFHGDRAVHAAREGIELPIGDYRPPTLAVPTLSVDTSEGYRPSMGQIVTFVTQAGPTAVEAC